MMENSERSLGELVQSLTQGVSSLVSQELALVKAEITQAVSRVVSGLSLFIVGSVIVGGAVLALAVGAILVAAIYFPEWMAVLAVGGVMLLVGLSLLIGGRRTLRGVFKTQK